MENTKSRAANATNICDRDFRTSLMIEHKLCGKRTNTHKRPYNGQQLQDRDSDVEKG